MREPTKIERKQFKRKRDNYVRQLKRNKLINDYLQRELRCCYTHGLPYIVNTEIHYFERVFWTASFIISLILVGSLIHSQYMRYFTDPVVMSVEIDYFKWNIPYPAITLCAKDNIDEEDLQSLINETLENAGVDISDTIKSVAMIGLDKVEMIDFNGALTTQQITDPRDFRSLSSILFKKFNNDTLTTSTNWPISVNSVFTELGMCHVINSNVASYDDPSIGENHVTYEKTNIDLSVFEKDFFVQLLTYAEEYKVYVHHPDETALITSPHYDVSKGYMSYAVKVWSTRGTDKLRSLPISYRNCRFLDEPISERYPVYSYNHCLLECRLRMMMKLCKCIPHFYKFLSHEKVCEVKQLKCIKHYIHELVKLSASDATWSKFINKDDLPKSPRDCNCLNNCETDIYLKDTEKITPEETDRVRIRISSFPKVRVVREIIFSIYDIILRSGGVMNLCMGTSIISLMELCMIAIKTCVLKVMIFIEYRRHSHRHFYKRGIVNKEK